MYRSHCLTRSIRGPLLLVAGFVAGCDSRPEAPELRDSPVYCSAQEGFHFLVPDVWTQTASAVLPEGDLEGETFLVRYRVKTPGSGTMIQVVCMQQKPSLDLKKYYAEPSFGVKVWNSAGDPETIDVNGEPAERFVFTAKSGGRDIKKEIISFRRNDRIYSFVALYAANDTKEGQQIRRAFESVIWE